MSTQITSQNITEVLKAVKATSPLVHNITNYVVMNNTANALLALGASPIMAHAQEEVAEMVGISGSLVINIGTLSSPWIKAMEQAVATADSLQKAWVLDPVGFGASALRNKTVTQLLATATPAVIRGNASEIMGMAAQAVKSKGVDSTAAAHQAIGAAQNLSNTLNCAVSVSGAVDQIIFGAQMAQIHNGSPLMTQVTGMGCTATAITGACLAVSQDHYLAAVSAMAIMGIAGDMAAEKAAGPGSFQMHFLDALHQLAPATLAQRLKIETDGLWSPFHLRHRR